MTPVLIGKGFLLEGSSPKIEDKHVPGIYIYISLSLSPSLYGTGRSLSALWACRGWQGGSEGIRVEFAKLEKIGEVHVEELVATVRGRAHRKNLQMLVNGIRSRLPTSTIFQGRLGPVPG